MEPTEAPDRQLDITRELCPMTFIRTKLELEEMLPGQILDVRLREGEPLANVTRSVAEEGHQIMKKAPQGAGLWLISIRVGQPEA